jgi:hypothetical protein
VPSLPIAAEPGQNRLEPPHDALVRIDPIPHGEEHVLLHLVFVGEAQDANHRARLAESVDTPDPLLDFHGIPRQIVVH